MSSKDEKLKGKLGARYITGNAGEASKFFKKAVSSTKLAVAYPKSHEEVNEIVRLPAKPALPFFRITANIYLPKFRIRPE